MENRIENQILAYLRFQFVPYDRAPAFWQTREELWKQGLAFTDTAGLTLHWLAKLKRRADFAKLPATIQQRLHRNFEDNVTRVAAITEEFIEFNSLLQGRNIRYLNLKGTVLYPDFMDCRENRVQYDHDFLVMPEDLPKAYELFLGLGYSPLQPIQKLAVDHLPTLIKRTGWQWQGNHFDPTIPRSVELHFQLWDPDFDLIPIRSLSNVWEDSTFLRFGSLSVPVLSPEHTLLHVTLHSFRHLLRNDLRLSHLYELAFFLEHHSADDEFWKRFLVHIAYCPWSLQAAATMFELACQLFSPNPGPRIQQFIDKHLTSAADLWIRQFGKRESIHCYRRSKSAILLHLSFVPGLSSKWALIRRRMIPRHLPLPSFGVQALPEQQDLRFHLSRTRHYVSQLFRRAWFHVLSLGSLLIALPFWCLKLRIHKKAGRLAPLETPLEIPPVKGGSRP